MSQVEKLSPINQSHDNAEVSGDGRFRRTLNAVKIGFEAAVVGAEVLPVNEAIRYGAFAVAQVNYGNPIMGGLVLGGVTMLIEGGAALAASDLLSTHQGIKVTSWAKDKLNKIVPENNRMSPLVESGVAYLGGSAVVLVAKQIENPERTKNQNRKHGLFTAAWLSGVLAVQGALAANGISNPNNGSVGAAIFATAGVIGAARWAKGRVNNSQTNQQPDGPAAPNQPLMPEELISFDSKRGMTSRLLDSTDQVRIDEALKLEQKVWNKKQYGSLEEYSKYMLQSSVYASYDEKGDCIGVSRVIGGTGELLPPFMDMPFDDPDLKNSLAAGCTTGQVEELGTVAVDSEKAPMIKTALSLWRLAYRFARSRDVKQWGIIMEPNRVTAMNARYGFTFKQAGPKIQYQGGMCAVHIMDLQEVDQNMSHTRPKNYDWFVCEPLLGAAEDTT